MAGGAFLEGAWRRGRLALLALLAGAAPAWAGPNLLQNGTFAAGSLAHWTLTNTGTTTSNAVVIATDNVARNYPTGAYGEAIPKDTLLTGSPDVSAGYAIYFSTDTGTQTLTQSVTLGIGTYGIGFDAFVPQNGYNNTHDATFTADIAGTSLLASSSVATIGATYGVTKWVTVSAQAQIAAAGTYTMTFSFTGLGSTAKDILVDRVYVTDLSTATGTAVPEPAGAALLALPLLALVLSRRRRQPR
ncbi:MAG: hypothetical protein KGI51_10235 [Rhodospirillales bacterium]|nr:hypothetical protein [Rhodospirillales bacterium]